MLSIIIPTYNEEENLRNLLPILKSELSTDGQLIIVDSQKSGDNAEGICKEYNAVYVASKERCRSRQLNEGAALAKNEKLFFLHADVVPPKGFYNLIIDFLKRPNDVGCFSYKFNSNKILLKVNAFFTRFDGLFAGGGDQGLFLYKSTFDHLGGYNNQLSIMEDFDLYDRIKKAGLNFTIINKASTVSARKYDKNSYLRVNVIQGIVVAKYRLGHSQDSIKRFYERWLA